MHNLSWRSLVRIHFYLLFFLLAQLIVDVLTGYRLDQQLIFYFTLALYVSGVILFYKNLKPFKWSAVYYAVYALTLLSYMLIFIGGMVVAIMASVLLYPVYPKTVKYKNADIKLYARYQGFMSPCCSYEVVRPGNLFVEKYVGYVDLWGPPPGRDALFKLGNKDTLFYQPSANDSVIILKIK